MTVEQSSGSSYSDDSTLFHQLTSSDKGCGVMVIDSNGLPVSKQGSIDFNNAGSYTTLQQLANQLSESTSSSNSLSSPTITIETDRSTLLLKEYASPSNNDGSSRTTSGSTVVWRVPHPLPPSKSSAVSS